MFLEKIKKIKENVNNNDDPLFWILAGLAVFILLLTFTAKSSIYFLLSLIFLFIFLLPFYIVKKKYKGLNWEKFILCFLFSLIHIFILCFIIKTLIWWNNDFGEQETKGMIYEIHNFIENVKIFSEISIFVFIIPIIIIISPFYFVQKKYKSFTQKRIIICVICTLLSSVLSLYIAAWGIALIMFSNWRLIF